MRLRSNHVTVDGVCLYYARGLENNWHLFFGCSFAEACWRQARLWSFIDQSFLSSSSFQELVFTLLDVFDDYQRQRFVMILWSMWNARNGKCWENKHTWPSHIIQGAMHFLHEWTTYNQLPPLALTPALVPDEAVLWKKPALGYFKVNVDAALNSATGRVGLGWIIRDDRGVFIMARQVAAGLDPHRSRSLGPLGSYAVGVLFGHHSCYF